MKQIKDHRGSEISQMALFCSIEYKRVDLRKPEVEASAMAQGVGIWLTCG